MFRFLLLGMNSVFLFLDVWNSVSAIAISNFFEKYFHGYILDIQASRSLSGNNDDKNFKKGLVNME